MKSMLPLLRTTHGRAADTGAAALSATPDGPLTVAAQRPGLITRVRARLFTAARGRAKAGPASAAAPPLGLQASLAELLLVCRLKARTRPADSASMLDRAAQIIFITCRNWFAAPHEKHTRHAIRL